MTKTNNLSTNKRTVRNNGVIFFFLNGRFAKKRSMKDDSQKKDESREEKFTRGNFHNGRGLVPI